MLQSFFRGFVYAAKGIAAAVQQERNFRFHICAALYVYVFSIFYHFSAIEYIVLTLVVVGVMAFELINSAVERVVDIACPAQAPLAGLAKDMAAGGVLVFSIGAAVCGIFLFGNKQGLLSIYTFFTTNIIWLVVFVCSIILCSWFIFGYNSTDEKRK